MVISDDLINQSPLLSIAGEVLGFQTFLIRFCFQTSLFAGLCVFSGFSLMIMLMADEASNFPLQYADDDFDEDMSMEYEKILHLLSEDLDPLQVGLLLLIIGEHGFFFFLFHFLN